jgi:hypothetical protein
MRLDKLERKRSPGERPTFRDPAFALGALFSLVVIVVIYLFSSGIEDPITRAEFLDIVPSGIAVFVALASLLITYRALIEQTKSRQAGTDPVILVHLGQREDAPILVMLEVENVGAGAARNISLKFEGIDLDSAMKEERFISDLRKLSSPISVLPQDKKVSYTLNTGPRLFQPEVLPDFFVQVNYSDIDGGQYSSVQRISVSELMEQSAHKSPPALVSEHLEKIEKHLKKLTSDSRRFFVISQDIDKFRDERAKESEHVREMLKKQKAE